MPRLEPKPAGEAATQLKWAACRLFAEHGIDGVSVREIAEAAGQKNHASVAYHFGSKDELIRSLLIDGAKVINDKRNAMLDDLEASGGPASIRQVTDIIVESSSDLPDDLVPPTFLRFVFLMGQTHRQMFTEGLGGRWNSGYLRALDLLRALMPDMPMAMKNQRLLFMGALIGGVTAARQIDAIHPERPHPLLQLPETLKHASAAAAAMLGAQVEEDFSAGLAGDPAAIGHHVALSVLT